MKLAFLLILLEINNLIAKEEPNSFLVPAYAGHEVGPILYKIRLLKGKEFCSKLEEPVRLAFVEYMARERPRCSEIDYLNKAKKATTSRDTIKWKKDIFFRPDLKENIPFQKKCILQNSFYKDLESFKRYCIFLDSLKKNELKVVLSKLILSKKEREDFVK